MAGPINLERTLGWVVPYFRTVSDMDVATEPTRISQLSPFVVSTRQSETGPLLENWEFRLSGTAVGRIHFLENVSGHFS